MNVLKLLSAVALAVIPMSLGAMINFDISNSFPAFPVYYKINNESCWHELNTANYHASAHVPENGQIRLTLSATPDDTHPTYFVFSPQLPARFIEQLNAQRIAYPRGSMTCYIQVHVSRPSMDIRIEPQIAGPIRLKTRFTNLSLTHNISLPVIQLFKEQALAVATRHVAPAPFTDTPAPAHVRTPARTIVPAVPALPQNRRSIPAQIRESAATRMLTAPAAVPALAPTTAPSHTTRVILSPALISYYLSQIQVPASTPTDVQAQAPSASASMATVAKQAENPAQAAVSTEKTGSQQAPALPARDHTPAPSASASPAPVAKQAENPTQATMSTEKADRQQAPALPARDHTPAPSASMPVATALSQAPQAISVVAPTQVDPIVAQLGVRPVFVDLIFRFFDMLNELLTRAERAGNVNDLRQLVGTVSHGTPLDRGPFKACIKRIRGLAEDAVLAESSLIDIIWAQILALRPGNERQNSYVLAHVMRALTKDSQYLQGVETLTALLAKLQAELPQVGVISETWNQFKPEHKLYYLLFIRFRVAASEAQQRLAHQ